MLDVIRKLCSLLNLLVLLCPLVPAHAENVAPSVHWGALDFPERERTMTAGLTINRFTEFDVHRNRFNAIMQSAGFNFATFSVTDRIPSFPAWSGNVTWGAGPTSEAPSRNLQSFVHHLSNQGMVPTDQVRDSTDFMIGGSVTRWSQLFSSRDTGFISIGVAGGSLYQEVYGRLGIRECSVADLAAWAFSGRTSGILKSISRYVRFSAMGRYSRPYGGSAYSSDVLANQSYLGQASVSLADFGESDGEAPHWVLEVAVTYDSGLFAAPNTHRILRRFGSVSLRAPYGTLELFDDLVGGTDSGPTFGFGVMLNVLHLYPLIATN